MGPARWSVNLALRRVYVTHFAGAGDRGRRSRMEDSAVLEARAADERVTAGQAGSADDAPAVESLTEFVLGRRMRAALDLLETRLDAGVPIESVLGDYLAPAARRLGALWDADRVTFTDVTVGVGRLQDLQRELGAHLLPRDAGAEAPRALLATAPGEQHAFGVAMAASLLHRRGWDVSGARSNRAEDLIGAAATGWYEVIGLSVGCDRNVATLGALVDRLCAASLNGRVRVVLGGRLARETPELLLDRLAGRPAVTVAADIDTLADLAESPLPRQAGPRR